MKCQAKIPFLLLFSRLQPQAFLQQLHRKWKVLVAFISTIVFHANPQKLHWIKSLGKICIRLLWTYSYLEVISYNNQTIDHLPLKEYETSPQPIRNNLPLNETLFRSCQKSFEFNLHLVLGSCSVFGSRKVRMNETYK